MAGRRRTSFSGVFAAALLAVILLPGEYTAGTGDRLGPRGSHDLNLGRGPTCLMGDHLTKTNYAYGNVNLLVPGRFLEVRRKPKMLEKTKILLSALLH